MQGSLFEGEGDGAAATAPDPTSPAGRKQYRRRYLRSFKYWSVCQTTYWKAGFACQFRGPKCTVTQHLQTHHCRDGQNCDFTPCYWNFGNERPGIDTVCVCGNCHVEIHRRYPSAANDNQPLIGESPPPDLDFFLATREQPEKTTIIDLEPANDDWYTDQETG